MRICNFFMISWLSPFSHDTITFYCCKCLTNQLSALFTYCRRQNKSSCLIKSHWILILVITETYFNSFIDFCVFITFATKQRAISLTQYFSCNNGHQLIYTNLSRFFSFFVVSQFHKLNWNIKEAILKTDSYILWYKIVIH